MIENMIENMIKETSMFILIKVFFFFWLRIQLVIKYEYKATTFN